jgi:hypothetical protein
MIYLLLDDLSSSLFLSFSPISLSPTHIYRYIDRVVKLKRGFCILISGERVSIEVPKKKGQKYQQRIWLEAQEYVWVIEESERLQTAPNVFISQLVKKMHEFYKEGKFTPILVQKETVEKEKKVILCPGCLEEFKDVATFTEHVKNTHEGVVKVK